MFGLSAEFSTENKFKNVFCFKDKTADYTRKTETVTEIINNFFHCRDVKRKRRQHILCAFTYHLYVFTNVPRVSLFYSNKLTVTDFIINIKF